MTYEQNRKEYEKNLKTGIIVSLFLHLIIIVPLMFERDAIPSFKEGIVTSKITDLELANIVAENYEIAPPGGGAGGGMPGIEAGKKIERGIPVPVSKEIKTDYDFISSAGPDSAKPGKNVRTGTGLGTGIGTGTGSGTGSGKGTGAGAGSGDGTALLPFTPKQILEVIPEKKDDYKGIIKLSVRIGKDGRVKDHKVLNNNTGSAGCLAAVLEAVYRSKWQAVKIEGKMVEYWTEKTYKFE